MSFAFATAGLSEAALLPEEVVVLVNAKSSESVRIGQLYMDLREVPSGHLIKVNTVLKDDVSFDHYNRVIAEPVRNIIGNLNDEGSNIRCIVTAYGIPLRIAALKPLIIPEKEINNLEHTIKKKREELSLLREKRKEPGAEKGDLKKAVRKLDGEIKSLRLRLGTLNGSDTKSAVDSELALLLSPDYPYAGWQSNPQFLPNRGKAAHFGRVLMVSRVDAPTPELAEELIRASIETEKEGLSGKIYLDARGLKGNSAYAAYDNEIRRAAQILQKGLLPVVLDNRPALFGSGEAPAAALYCGWYSLGKYQDAFQWVKGAVGYHVASAEARSLHSTKHAYWVKSMIERGVVASLGPVSEPYLHAFPHPSLFFPLLMTGQYTIAEVFAMTNPLLSWRMILVGDPLYNPFKNRPAYFHDNLPSPP